MNASERLASVQAKIADACAKAGRDPSSVRLIAVSKTKPFAQIAEYAALGQVDFGENYVQEALQKVVAGPNLRWHLIGNLQSNKAKLIAGKFHLFHALDSLSLAEKIGKVAAQDCLLEVNVDSEASKGGVAPAEVLPLLEKLRAVPNIQMRGLMAIPAPGQGRKPFAALRELREKAEAAGFSLPELSMGMSADYADAILEGATYVRVGTALFGERS